MHNKIIISLFIAPFLSFCTTNKKVEETKKEVVETVEVAPVEVQKNLNPKVVMGNKFLAEKSREKGVVTLPSGLRYKVLTPGIGAKPLATNTIKAHYHGTLIDGTVFDSSVDRGQPFTAPVSRLIKGWTEALQLMQVGGKWELYIPYNLAYGTRGAGKSIKPYETLIFQIELLEIVK